MRESRSLVGEVEKIEGKIWMKIIRDLKEGVEKTEDQEKIEEKI